MEFDKIGGSDEDLVRSFYSGDTTALGSLIKRYEHLWYYIFKTSNSKDKSLIDDILSETFLAMVKELKSVGFIPKDKGSFRSWIYEIAHHRCIQANKKMARQPINLSKEYMESFGYREKRDDIETYQYQMQKLNEALTKLAPKERRLFELRRQGLSYRQIQPDPYFQYYSIGQLRVKYCRIIETLRTILKEGQKNGEQEKQG